jgi:predicted RNA binding protein YcfA (HicA-like mRNA interferase family)
MTRMPRLDGKTLVAILLKAGFRVDRTKGSHHILKHPDGRKTTVPIHSGDVIRPKLLGSILEDCNLTKDDLINLLQ